MISYIHAKNCLLYTSVQWCDGSYLEDQDKLRMSGIFRQVLLLRRPRARVQDYCVTAEPDETLQTAAVRIRLQKTEPGLPVRCTLLSPDEMCIRDSMIPFLPGVRKKDIWISGIWK